MTLDDALAALRAEGDPTRAEGMAAYHKSRRVYLGTPMPPLNDMVAEWRGSLSLDDRLSLAAALWETDIHEARIAAAKLLTQARMRPSDAAAWQMITGWVPQFDGWAIADHVCSAGGRRIMADLDRLDTVESWTTAPDFWTRRAALVMTLPLAHLPFPKAPEQEARERVLGWAARYAQDQNWFIQKAVAWWLRDLSKHDSDRVRTFLQDHAAEMKNFATKEASKYL